MAKANETGDRSAQDGASRYLTFALCFSAALVEGFDLQSAGVAAPKFAPVFGLTPGQLGWVFSANTLGLFLGAAFGGWLSDRVGRRAILVSSMFLFGLFSIGTALAPPRRSSSSCAF